MPDEKGLTRRERNDRFGVKQTPDFDVPIDGVYLWGWYWTISDRLRRIVDGVCEPIKPSEFLAWCTASATIVYPVEYGILCAMDDAFCSAMNDELREYRTRTEDQQKAEAEKARARGGRRK